MTGCVCTPLACRGGASQSVVKGFSNNNPVFTTPTSEVNGNWNDNTAECQYVLLAANSNTAYANFQIKDGNGNCKLN